MIGVGLIWNVIAVHKTIQIQHKAMKTSLQTNFLILFCIVLLQSCVINFGDDKFLAPLGDTQQTYQVKDFDSIQMGNAFDVRVRQSSVYNLSIRGDKADLNDILVETKNGILLVYYKNSGYRRRQVYIDLSMPSLYNADLSGAVTGSVSGFDESTLKINLSGASQLDLSAKARKITLSVSGASSIDMTGNGQNLTGNISGASTINAYAWTTTEANLDLSGASKVRVNVEKLLTGVATGASSVFYKGNPTIDLKTSGASTVQRN
jgi:hypothetical protein